MKLTVGYIHIVQKVRKVVLDFAGIKKDAWSARYMNIARGRL